MTIISKQSDIAVAKKSKKSKKKTEHFLTKTHTKKFAKKLNAMTMLSGKKSARKREVNNCAGIKEINETKTTEII